MTKAKVVQQRSKCDLFDQKEKNSLNHSFLDKIE